MLLKFFTTKCHSKKYLAGLTMILVILATFAINVEYGNAAQITSHSDTLSRLGAGASSDHEWKFVTPTGVDATSDTIIYEFDVNGTAFDLSQITISDIDLLEDTDATPGDCSGTLTQKNLVSSDGGATDEWLVTINTTSDTITVTPAGSGDTGATIAQNACVILRVGQNASGGSSQIVNPTTAGSYQMGVSGTFGDSGEVAIEILSNDQVQATASVDESLTFSISDNAIGFGTLSASSARYATGDEAGSSSEVEAHTVVAGTNASNGYVISINGNTLTSGANTITAIGGTNTASSPGTEQFGIRATASGGSGVVSAPYNGSGFALDTAAFPDEFATVSGPSPNTTYSIRYIANISSNTEAGTYTSTLTFIATAAF